MMSASDVPRLFGVTWRLTTIEDLSGIIAANPTGYDHLQFHLRYRPPEDLGTSTVGATDSRNSQCEVRIDGDRMKFGMWINDLVIRSRASSATDARPPGVPTGPLTITEHRFICKALTGTVSWTLRDRKLTFTKPEIGSLTYVPDLDP